jgi:hypothetical protein
MPTPKRPTTEAAREAQANLTREYTVAEYNYLLECTEDSLVKYRQARAMISYADNIVYSLYAESEMTAMAGE